jgi:hypothetical protein
LVSWCCRKKPTSSALTGSWVDQMETSPVKLNDDQRRSPVLDEATTAEPTATMAPDSATAEIAALSGLRIFELRAAWVKKFCCPAPSIQSTDVVRRLFAWRLQVESYGDLSPVVTTKLAQTRSAVVRGDNGILSPTTGLHSGAVLVREWRGVEHRVEVLDEGFLHQDHRYTSLSEVARAITGTRWSGPRFFGLDHQSGRSVQPATDGASS